jgi:hypothetical protein
MIDQLRIILQFGNNFWRQVSPDFYCFPQLIKKFAEKSTSSDPEDFKYSAQGNDLNKKTHRPRQYFAV